MISHANLSKERSLKRFIAKCVIIFLIFITTFSIFIITKLPEYFDSYVYIDNYKFIAHLWLVFYRAIMYFIFPFILTIFERLCKKRKNVKFRYRLIENFNVQFCTYSLIASFYTLFGVDKILDADIFGSSDAFLFITGFIFTTVLNKGIPDLFSD